MHRYFSCFAVSVVMACVSALSLVGCERPTVGQSPATTRPAGGGPAGGQPVPVTVAKAVQADVERYLDEIGSATAVEEVLLRAQVQGVLTEVRVKDGDAVAKGDVLFRIDARPYEAALSQARAELASTEAELTAAKRDFDRISKLPPGAASAQDLDTALSAVERLTARTAVNRAQIHTAEINLSYTDVRSPLTGRLGRVLVTAGNVVSPGSGGQVLAELRSFDPMFVDFSTPERNLDEVREALQAGRAQVEVRVPGSAEALSGRLTFIDNRVESGLGVVRLRGTVANANSALWPGRFVNVRLVTGRDVGVTLIPADAVDIGEGGARAFVVNADNSVELRRPKLGQRQPPTTPGGPDRIVVLDGIRPGEMLVIRGRWLLRPDSKVRVVADSAAAGAPAATAPAATAPATPAPVAPAARP